VVQKNDYLPFISADKRLQHFRGVYNSATGDWIPRDTYILGPENIEELDADFIIQEIRDFVKKQKNGKASGYDDVPVKYWKTFCSLSAGIEVLVEVFLI
jgi:hypothetical protein